MWKDHNDDIFIPRDEDFIPGDDEGITWSHFVFQDNQNPDFPLLTYLLNSVIRMVCSTIISN